MKSGASENLKHLPQNIGLRNIPHRLGKRRNVVNQGNLGAESKTFRFCLHFGNCHLRTNRFQKRNYRINWCRFRKPKRPKHSRLVANQNAYSSPDHINLANEYCIGANIRRDTGHSSAVNSRQAPNMDAVICIGHDDSKYEYLSHASAIQRMSAPDYAL